MDDQREELAKLGAFKLISEKRQALAKAPAIELTAASLVQLAIDEIIEARKKLSTNEVLVTDATYSQYMAIDDHLINALKALGT